MRYLTLSADYMQPSLRDHADGPIAIDRAGFFDEVQTALLRHKGIAIIGVGLSAQRNRVRMDRGDPNSNQPAQSIDHVPV